MKKHLLFVLMITALILPGCSVVTAKVALTLVGAAATTVAGVYKYKGDQEKAAAIINFRDEVRGDLAIIKKELEKNRHELH